MLKAVCIIACIAVVVARPSAATEPKPPMNTALLAPSPVDDSTVDLQALIDEAASNGENRVTLPAGIHRVNSMLRLRKLRDFTFEGAKPDSAEDTVIVFTTLDGGISVSDCTRLTLRGFTIDFDPLPFTQGTIDSIDFTTGTLTYTVHDGYPDITEERLTTRAHIFSRDTFEWKPAAPDIYASNAQIISPRRAMLRFDTDRRWQLSTLAPGDLIAQDIRHRLGALRIEPADDVTVSHVTIRSAPGLAMTLRFMGGKNHFKHITIAPGAPPEGATMPRLLSTSADGFNYAYARTGPTLENCDFSRMGDDSVNLHGIAFAVADSGVDPAIGPFITLIRPYGMERFLDILRPGDELRALSQTNFDILGESEIVRTLPARSSREADDLRLADEIFPIHRPVARATLYRLAVTRPLDLKPGDLVEIPAISAPGYVIRGNRFSQHRARALRIMSPNGIIEDNFIEGIKQAPITLGAEFVGFREAGWVHNIAVRRNIIKNSGFDPALTRSASYAPGAISVMHRGESPSSPLPVIARHHDIIIEENIIDNVGGPAIHINQATRVTVRANHISRAHQNPATTSGNTYGLSTANAIEVDNSVNVTVSPTP
jgi:hypothetical protein